MRVVEDEQQGAAIGEIGDQPVEAVEYRADAVAGLSLIRDDLEHRRGELRSPGKRADPAVRDAWPEKLSNRGERRLHRHLVTPCPQHRQTEPHPPLDARVQQRRLPDPGRTLDQDKLAASESSLLERAMQRAQLLAALNQPPGNALRIHPGPIIRPPRLGCQVTFWPDRGSARWRRNSPAQPGHLTPSPA